MADMAAMMRMRTRTLQQVWSGLKTTMTMRIFTDDCAFSLNKNIQINGFLNWHTMTKPTSPKQIRGHTNLNCCRYFPNSSKMCGMQLSHPTMTPDLSPCAVFCSFCPWCSTPNWTPEVCLVHFSHTLPQGLCCTAWEVHKLPRRKAALYNDTLKCT